MQDNISLYRYAKFDIGWSSGHPIPREQPSRPTSMLGSSNGNHGPLSSFLLGQRISNQGPANSPLPPNWFNGPSIKRHNKASVWKQWIDRSILEVYIDTRGKRYDEQVTQLQQVDSLGFYLIENVKRKCDLGALKQMFSCTVAVELGIIM